MKVKIILDKDENIDQAEETLAKALKVKNECSGYESYFDNYLNEFHDFICAHHATLVENILKEIEQEINSDVNKKNST